MDDIDMLLSMVENPTRRRILEAIVRERTTRFNCRRNSASASRPS